MKSVNYYYYYLESLDNKGSGGGDNLDGGLPVLNGQFDGDLQTFPVLGGLGNVVTNLLGRQTQGTDLGGQGRGGGDLASDGTKAHDLKQNKVITFMTTTTDEDQQTPTLISLGSNLGGMATCYEGTERSGRKTEGERKEEKKSC